ncbi:MAG: anti-sigma factor domain-containing protein [Thermaerobacterales bacterium]
MKSRKGMVLEIKNSKAVVLDARGAFRRIPVARSVRVGDHIDVPAGGRSFLASAAAASGRRGIALAAAAAILLAVLIPALLFYERPAEAVAIIQMDDGRLVEFSLDAAGRVIHVSGAGEPPGGWDYLYGLPASEALGAFMADRAYGHEGAGDVLMSVVPVAAGATGATIPEVVSAEFRKGEDQVASALAARGAGKPVTFQVEASEARATAQERGTTVPRLVIQAFASAEGHEIGAGDLNHPALIRVLEDRGIELEALVTGRAEVKNFGQLLQEMKDDREREADPPEKAQGKESDEGGIGRAGEKTADGEETDGQQPGDDQKAADDENDIDDDHDETGPPGLGERLRNFLQIPAPSNVPGRGGNGGDGVPGGGRGGSERGR